MIIEGICTTTSPDGTVNIAPMGPVVDPQLSTFLFRPFQTSTTFANLQATGCGVFHVTDDVFQLVQAALGEWREQPPLQPAQHVAGRVLSGACRAYEFEVIAIDDSRDRAEIRTRLLHVEWLRDFWGWNRAQHAIIETTILATRLHLVPEETVRAQLEQCAIIVDKTAGPNEQAAFELLKRKLAGDRR